MVARATAAEVEKLLGGNYPAGFNFEIAIFIKCQLYDPLGYPLPGAPVREVHDRSGVIFNM